LKTGNTNYINDWNARWKIYTVYWNEAYGQDGKLKEHAPIFKR